MVYVTSDNGSLYLCLMTKTQLSFYSFPLVITSGISKEEKKCFVLGCFLGSCALRLSYLDVSTDLFLAWLYVNYIVYVLVIFVFQGLARYKNLKQRLE